LVSFENIVLSVEDDIDSLIIITSSKNYIIPRNLNVGFTLKGSETSVLEENIRSKQYRAFHVEPEEVETYYYYEEVPENIKKDLDMYLSKLPREVAEEFRSAGTEISIIKYMFTEVDLDAERRNETLILKHKEKPDAKKFSVEAVKATIYYGGSICCPMSTYASKTLEKWKQKYPENTIIQRNIYAKNYEGYKRIDSTLSLKIVLKTPQTPPSLPT